MAISTIGRPFQGKAWYWVEATYGGGLSGATLPISKYIQDIKMGTGDVVKSIRSIESAVIIEQIQQCEEPTIHIEYNPQIGDTMIDDCVDRSSCCILQSLAFEFGANTCTGGDDTTYFYGVGFKAATVKISAAKDEPYSVVIDYEGKSIVTSTTAIGVEPTALSGAILQFNVAGSITKTGGFNPTGSKIAYITDSIDVTISNQLTGYTDHDSTQKTFLVEGTLDVEGSCNITLDGAGGMHFGEVKAMTDFTLVINMGDTGAPKITLPGCNWKNSEPGINTSGEAMMESAAFVCTPTDCASFVDVVA
ncbi:MAG: hypothetical protein DRO67_05475 [Candidatus Asgardarchaeum californiense]|nr:MAG: hypothetical protein DRO67_05475 [Candidatus Asgardarchaeum californiense]